MSEVTHFQAPIFIAIDAIVLYFNPLAYSQAGSHGRVCGRTRELYANIEEPKTAQTILRRPKSPHLQPYSCQPHPLIPDHLANSVGGPEKAGVGGSIPSLATMFSIAYKAPLRRFHSISSKTMARDDSPRLECWSVAEWLASRFRPSFSPLLR